MYWFEIKKYVFIIVRKKKKKDKSKNKGEQINIEENQDKINHGMYIFSLFL